MSKTMAEVLAEHQFMHHSFNGVTQKRYLACSCGALPLAGDHPTHLAEALSAAGFGLVADTKAEALEEAADDFAERVAVTRIMTRDNGTAYATATLNNAYGMEMAATALRARAAALRGDS